MLNVKSKDDSPTQAVVLSFNFHIRRKLSTIKSIDFVIQSLILLFNIDKRKTHKDLLKRQINSKIFIQIHIKCIIFIPNFYNFSHSIVAYVIFNAFPGNDAIGKYWVIKLATLLTFMIRNTHR